MKLRLLAPLFVLAIPCTREVWPQTPAGSGGGQRKASVQSTLAIQAADAAFRQGYAAFERNDLAAARVSFERAVRLAPAIAAAHGALGAVLVAAGESSRAVAELETAQTLGLNDRSTLLNLCVAYTNTGNYAGTVKTFHLVETLSEVGSGQARPLPADASVAVATALSETGDLAAAEAVLRKTLAAATEEDTAPVHDALGAALAQRQQYKESETEFLRALALDSTAAKTHYRLGLVQMATNRPREAVAELARAHELDGTSVAYVIELSKALAATSQETTAIGLLRTALANSPQSDPGKVDLTYQLALTLQSAGDSRQAMPLFIEAVRGRPQNAQILTNTALCYVQLGDAKTAVPLYLQALKLNPADPTVHQDLGVAYLQQADLDHALEQFRAGLALDPESPQLHYDLGLALKLKDDLAAAVPEFERAGALDPTLPDPPYTLGILYMQQGQFERSASSLERVIQLSPDNGDAWATLGSVYQQMQQPEKAVPALRRAIALLPRQPSPHINLAAILAAKGNKEEAAAERRTGADLTRAAVNRQKADFGLDSGKLMMKRGQAADALVQFENAVEADPGYAAPHAALADALDRTGRKAEAAEERRKAAALEPASETAPH